MKKPGRRLLRARLPSVGRNYRRSVTLSRIIISACGGRAVRLAVIPRCERAQRASLEGFLTHKSFEARRRRAGRLRTTREGGPARFLPSFGTSPVPLGKNTC
jgi:hypothetical protein